MLEVSDLQFKYPPHFCLQGISFKLQAGDRVLLKGPNGSGKSTLLRLLGGLLISGAGSIKRSQGAARTVIAGHNPSVYPYLSVRENLEFWLQIERSKEKRHNPALYLPDEALTLMGLGKAACDKASSLSRGMLQRLDLARILCSNASLILLDEPENSLEQRYLEIFCREIQTRTDKAIVWASHIMEANFKPAGTTLFTHTFSLQENAPCVFGGQLEQIPGAVPC